MDIQSIQGARPLFSLRSGRFAAGREEANAAAAAQDQMNISQAGKQAAADAEGGISFDQMAERLEAQLGTMTKEDFLAMVQEQTGGQTLEINWNAAVDPDGSIWAKSYIESLYAQCAQARSVIESYYTDAYQEALDSPLGSDLSSSLNFIAGKYQCSWSDFFDAGMPAGQRQWTYTQVRSMLTGTQVRLNDPYALAGSGLDPKKMDEIARQSARSTLSNLILRSKGTTPAEN